VPVSGVALLYQGGPILALVASLTALLASGCGSVSVHRTDEAWPGAVSRALVLPLDDRALDASAADYTLFGRIGGQGSGAAVARAMRQALAQELGVLPPDHEALYKYTAAHGLKASDLATLDADSARAMASAVGSDTVVTGKVRACGTAWMLFVPLSRLSFDVTAVRSDTGEPLWRAEYRARSLTESEWELARRGATAIARRLAGE